jgi:membrane-bound lytic murein transglycosylase B
LRDGSLPAKAPDAALVAGQTRAFLVNHNYDAVLEYNCSHAYAIGVSLLSDRIAGSEPLPRPAKAHKPSKRKHTKQR